MNGSLLCSAAETRACSLDYIGHRLIRRVLFSLQNPPKEERSEGTKMEKTKEQKLLLSFTQPDVFP